MADLFSNLGPLQRALDYHSERHNVVASNIANANTPGFRPLELLRADATDLSATLPLAHTQEAHLSTTGDTVRHETSVVEDQSSVGGLDGNSVSLEREMSKLAANDLRYQSAAKMLTHKLAMLRYAANDGSGSGG
jgi:flagellar basal-body rod protein FlgB